VEERGKGKGKEGDEGKGRKGRQDTGKGKGICTGQSKGKGSGTDQTKGKGKSQSNTKSAAAREVSVRILTGECPPGFALRGRLLGKGGENFKYISSDTGVRLSLESSSSSSNDSQEQQPTHIRIIANGSDARFRDAINMVKELLEVVQDEVERALQGSQARSGQGAIRDFSVLKDANSRQSAREGRARQIQALRDAELNGAKDLTDKAAKLKLEAEEKVKSIIGLTRAAEEAKEIKDKLAEAKNDAISLHAAALERVQPDASTYAVLLGRERQRINTTKTIQERILEVKFSEANGSAKLLAKLGVTGEKANDDNIDVKGFVSAAKRANFTGIDRSELTELEGLIARANTTMRDAHAAKERAKMISSRPTASLDTLAPPSEGMSINRCSASQISDLKKLWDERQARSGQVMEAWKVDNPLLTWHFNKRYQELKRALGRAPDELQGYHGTHPDNVLSICQNGFDSSKRAGQVYGSGEYFAKCPDVSVGYCKGGQYMLICRLLLGVQSSNTRNTDGDHIWVPSCSYYVISGPAQVLPLYIIKFQSRASSSAGPPPDLVKILTAGSWSTKQVNAVVPVPRNRRCIMTRPSATVLWIGYLHAHFSDEQLEQDVRNFLQAHAASHMEGLKVQVVKGTFKKAHAVLRVPMPRDLVHQLNRLPFVEGGALQRTVCVEDAHGSPEQMCPKRIAGYCRGQNLRFTHPCWCSHPERETEGASYELEKIDLQSAKANEILGKFMMSAPFHDGQPRVTGVRAIINHTLTRCHEEYRKYLCTKHGEEPTVRELYHGTNNKILDVLYTHGLQPPSDVNASDACPVSGGKGLSTTLCPNTCKFCTEKHEWDKCHMYGLGIYLADMAQKSHRYCSQPRVTSRGTREYKMVVCSVLGKAFTVEGHLRQKQCMHDVVNVRALQKDELAGMVEPLCQPCNTSAETSFHPVEVAEKSDLLFVKGLGCSVRPGYSVVNSEYIAFHPHQCMPKYEITYEM